jgi:hypothetical protein
MTNARAGFLVLALLAACAGGEKIVREDPDPGPGDGGSPEPIDPCPESQPKIGDRCGSSEGMTCTYPNGPCTNPNGMVYEETINYCCIGEVWSTCGGYSPCDIRPLPAPIGDAVQGDAHHDDGSADAGADAEADAPIPTDPAGLDAAAPVSD